MSEFEIELLSTTPFHERWWQSYGLSRDNTAICFVSHSCYTTTKEIDKWIIENYPSDKYSYSHQGQPYNPGHTVIVKKKESTPDWSIDPSIVMKLIEKNPRLLNFYNLSRQQG